MARIAVGIEGDLSPDHKFVPYPPRFNVELPPTSCFTEDKDGSVTRKFFATPEELTDHLNQPVQRKNGRKLYILEGLPIEYVQVFGAHFDMDVNIFDSHSKRRSAKLSELKIPATPGYQKKVQTFALDHPEITTNIVSPPEENGGVVGDFMLPCQTIDISKTENGNAVNVKLCHMTLASFPTENGDETLLLLLENQSWVQRGVQSQPASHHSILASALASLPEEKQRWKPSRKHDPALTLADEIFDAIDSSSRILAWDNLTEVLTDIVLRQWRFAFGEIIELACASRIIRHHEIHQICGLIESNIWTLNSTEAIWSPRYDVRIEGFKGLLKKAKRCAELIVWGQILEKGLETKTKIDNNGDSHDDDDDDDDATSTASSKSGVHIRGGEAFDMETRQSINRVTYLGGVLLPFSIIAAIFSMGGSFQPGGDQFFIFWVIAIPVCMLTTALIYADSIRRMTLEQFAQQYGSTAVKEEVNDTVGSPISGSEIIPYKASIKERFASHIPGAWNRRTLYAVSSSSVGYTDSDSDDGSSSTNSNQLPPGLSIDDDLLVGKKNKRVTRSWSWRFWRRKPLVRKSDPENVPPSPIRADHNLSSSPAPPVPPVPSTPSGSHAIPSSPQITPLEPVPVGNNSSKSLPSDHFPIAGPAPPKTPSTRPPSPDPKLTIPGDTIPEPAVPDQTWDHWGTPSKKAKKDNRRRKRKLLHLDDDIDGPHRLHPVTPPAHPSTQVPADVPLPPSDSDSDFWRERYSSELIHPERSPSPDLANSDCTTDSERRSLEKRMRENDDWGFATRRRRKQHKIEREIIRDRRHQSEHSAKSEESKPIHERTQSKGQKSVNQRGRMTDYLGTDDDSMSVNRGRKRERSTIEWAHRGTYHGYPRRSSTNADPTEMPLPPSPEELPEEERMRMRLQKEKLEYLERLKEREHHKEMAEVEEERAKRRAEEEYAKKRAEKEYARKRAEEEHKKEDAERRAAKGKNRAYSPVAPDVKGAKPAIKFKDAVGRKFLFPFHLVSTWAGMEELIKQAFLHIDVIGPHVIEGHYDLVGPTGEIILPQVWESVIEPDWSVTMYMWPMPEPQRQAPAPMPPGLGRPGPPPPPPGFTSTEPGGLKSGPIPKMKRSTVPGAWPLKTGVPLSKPSPGIVVIKGPPTKIHRRQTGMSERHRHGISGGGITGGATKPDEELGWVRALGTIVGVKPVIQVKKRSGESSSGSLVTD